MSTVLLSTHEVAEELGLKYGQIIRRIRSGKILATKVGWGWVISEEEVNRYKRDNSGEEIECQ